MTAEERRADARALADEIRRVLSEARNESEESGEVIDVPSEDIMDETDPDASD
jgi:hypothetical protein